MIYPAEDEGSTSHRKMDSSARKSDPPGNNTRADFLSRHVKSEHAVKSEHTTNGSNRKVVSPVRKINSVPSERSTHNKTSPCHVKTEPDTDSGRTQTRSSSRPHKHEEAIRVNKPKVDPLSKFFKIEREGESDRSHSSGFKSYKSNVSIKTETTTSKSEGFTARTTTSRSRSGDGATSGSRSGDGAGVKSYKSTVGVKTETMTLKSEGVTARTTTSMSRSGDGTTSGSRSGGGAEVNTWVKDEAAQLKRPYRLVDISANLTHRKYMEDLSQVIQRSKAAGKALLGSLIL